MAGKFATFSDYLILSELQMNIGAEEDPQEVLKRVRLAQRNPVRAANAEREAAMNRQQVVAIDKENPEQSQDMRSAQVNTKAATLQARDVRRKQGRQDQQDGMQGQDGGMGESLLQSIARQIIEDDHCVVEEVWVHEPTGEIFEGDDLLTEGFRRQFKRFGNEFRRKFRCMAGPKAGKLVTDAANCGRRPDPKKVRKGRAVMRAKKQTVVRKSKIAKRLATSKIVTKMNKRLMGKKV